MKRLTIRGEDGTPFWLEFARDMNESEKAKDRKRLARLAAYEDTGLEPEEIELYKEAQESCESISPKRLTELIKAEKDGRLVVLPSEAKEGDPIPQCFYGDSTLCPGLCSGIDDEPIEMCKRCWYCSTSYYRMEDSAKTSIDKTDHHHWAEHFQARFERRE